MYIFQLMYLCRDGLSVRANPPGIMKLKKRTLNQLRKNIQWLKCVNRMLCKIKPVSDVPCGTKITKAKI